MIMKIGYIEIPVSDMKVAVDFYGKLFGPKKLFESEKHVLGNYQSADSLS